MPIKKPVLPSIIFTVTNNLLYDQRMIRICTSLSQNGYDITLIGSKLPGSAPLPTMPFKQKRLPCFFQKGKLFYAEFNTRLFFCLIFQKADVICAIDLDTIIPCYLFSRMKQVQRVYDAHEYFSQQKEVLGRPFIYRCWHWIEKKFIPLFPDGYTVSGSIARAFKEQYGAEYEVIRNLPVLNENQLQPASHPGNKIILYQGAVNESRGLEYLVPAMKDVDATLHIYGDGNFMAPVKQIILANNLENKVFMKGKLEPGALKLVTGQATIGINLVENSGLNQYYSLANKFFDYIQHAIPQVTMNYPEYELVNKEHEVAVLIGNLQPQTIAGAINRLLNDEALYNRLRNNCGEARKVYNWQAEEKKLLAFYRKIIG